MNTQDIDELISITEKLEKILGDFEAITDGLMNCETEDTESINNMIMKRSDFIEEMKPLKERIKAIINEQPSPTATIIRELYSGGKSSYTPPELYPLQKAAVNFRSAQEAAVTKEQLLEKQFTSRYYDLKDMLIKLREDKRKIDFYNTIQSRQLGNTLDSRS